MQLFQLSSTSLWGRELKGNIHIYGFTIIRVDLLVRSWIERLKYHSKGLPHRSTSLWGRELKDQQRMCFDRALLVDLLVRSWIERQTNIWYVGMLRSTSLWGRELKGSLYLSVRSPVQVDLLVRSWIERSWPISIWNNLVVDLLVRSWIERYSRCHIPSSHRCRPPCEVVNWKFLWNTTGLLPVPSTSLWGRELKDITIISCKWQ